VFYASTVAPASSLVPFTALANRDRCRLLGGQRRAGIVVELQSGELR